MEDSDVKIFTKNKKEDSIDEIALIAEMNKQRNNGNTEKSKKLGKHLAALFLDESTLLKSLEDELGTIDFPQSILFQIKILMFFTAEYCINRNLPSNTLKSTAINALYDSIHNGARDFYNEFSDGAEYSFYYLALRDGEDVGDEIGKAFAMLCGKEKETAYVALGEHLWILVFKEVQKIIEQFSFEK